MANEIWWTGSGIYKSTDGGQNWTKLEKGLPKIIGKSGISVSRANSKIIYVNLEAEGDKSGVIVQTIVELPGNKLIKKELQ